MKFSAAILSIIFLLSSCTMEPKYERPKSPVSENISSAKAEDDVAPISIIKWQEFFKSEDLKKIIQTTLDNNRDLKIAVLNIDAARALYRISKADLLPNIDANGSLSRSKIPSSVNNGFGVIPTRYDANLSTAFEFDLFGRIRSQNKMALETFFANQENKNAVQISLIAEVVSAYLQFGADQEILRLAKENLKDQQKSFGSYEAKYKVGVISKYDFLQAQTIIESTKASIATYENKVTQDKNALLLLMGISNSELLEKKVSLDDIKLLEDLTYNMKSEVLLSRPDIMRAEHNLKSANANIGYARAAFFPVISLSGTVGYASNELSTLLSSSNTAWNFTPQITMPIFAAGRNKANLDYAKISKNIYIAEYEKAIQSAFGEVADELSNKQTIDERLRAQFVVAKSNEDSYKISLLRYKAGIDSFAIVALIENQMFLSEQAYISLKQERLANMVRIYKVFGGGVE